jgi:hypothetical protein
MERERNMRTTAIGLLAIILSGLTACITVNIADKTDDSGGVDSTPPVEEPFVFSVDDFPGEVDINDVLRLTFRTRDGGFWGYALDVKDGYACAGAPVRNNNDGAVGCWYLDDFSYGDIIGVSDLSLLAEGGDGIYPGLGVHVQNGFVYSGDQGYTRTDVTDGSTEHGLTWVFPLSLTGVVAGSDQTLSMAAGTATEDWVDVVFADSQTAVVRTSASATGYVCPVEWLTDGTFADLTSVTETGCDPILANSSSEFSWPWYRAEVMEGTREIFSSDTQLNYDDRSNAGVVSLHDSSNGYVNAVAGPSLSQFGATILPVGDVNSDGYDDVMAFSSERDFMAVIGGGPSMPILSNLVYGPVIANGGNTYEDWGIDADITTIVDDDGTETTLVVVGARFTNNRTGAAYVYVLDDLLTEQPPFLTIHGEVSNDTFGYSTAFSADTFNSYEEAELTVCGAEGGICETFSLQSVIDTTVASRRSKRQKRQPHEMVTIDVAPEMQWLFPQEVETRQSGPMEELIVIESD